MKKKRLQKKILAELDEISVDVDKLSAVVRPLVDRIKTLQERVRELEIAHDPPIWHPDHPLPVETDQ